MPKKLIAAIVLVIIAGVAFTAQSRYVRKQRQPDFFMPEKVHFNQPEKLPALPKKEVIKKVQKKETSIAEIKSEAKTESVVFVPEFQRKFDDYNHDISYISRSGEIPQNELLTADLAAMNSNARFLVEEKPWQESAVSRAFDRALEQVLEAD